MGPDRHTPQHGTKTQLTSFSMMHVAISLFSSLQFNINFISTTTKTKRSKASPIQFSSIQPALCPAPWMISIRRERKRDFVENTVLPEFVLYLSPSFLPPHQFFLAGFTFKSFRTKAGRSSLAPSTLFYSSFNSGWGDDRCVGMVGMGIGAEKGEVYGKGPC